MKPLWLPRISPWHSGRGDCLKILRRNLLDTTKGFFRLKSSRHSLASSSPLSVPPKRVRQTGALSLISSFMIFIFTIFGLGLIYLSHIHLRISGSQKNVILSEYAAENGIKQSVNQLIEILSQYTLPSSLSPNEFEKLRESFLLADGESFAQATGNSLPLATGDSRERQSWTASTFLSLERLVEREAYFLAQYSVSVNSEGIVKNFKQRKRALLTGSVGMFAGFLPLSFIPFLVDKQMEDAEKEDFTQKNHIDLSLLRKDCLPQKIQFSDQTLIPKDVQAELFRALRVDLFHPKNLTCAQLRYFLGLEVNSDPVPEGVYLIQDSLGLGGIYIEGDVKEMILAVDHEFQVIYFCLEQGTWMIRYSPLERKTSFTSPTGTASFNLIPRGIVFISGNVASLGGGTVSPSGEVVMVKDREIPSLLRGVQLTIICSGTITISSHLIQQGVKQEKGIPYAKDTDSHLILMSTGKNFWDETEKEGGIIIADNTPQELNIQASLTASGKGFIIKGSEKNIRILGSLQTHDYISNGNSLAVIFDNLWQETQMFPKNAPATKDPVIFISYFKAHGWEEI